MGLIIDSFAGGGGASTGIELAGCHVDIAINHDPAAIAMHRANHQTTRHYCESVWDVDPVEACGGQSVDLAWFSPDCKHFSKAKGAALVDRHIRGLAWIVLRWAGTVRPRIIILENVEEFVTWCPVRKGKPVKKLTGQTFEKWKGQLVRLGYKVEHRELVAADYGAPTSRKRFYLIARCDGEPIVWPNPTHGAPGTLEVVAGTLKPWRTAAEIIDWSIPAPSIFATKQEIKKQYGVSAVRPLADNTLRRVIRGVDKFTLTSGKPFIVQQKFDNQAQSAEAPLTTITAVGAHEVIVPYISPFARSSTSNSIGSMVDEPINTVRTGGGCGQMLVCPSICQYHSERTEKVRGQSVDEPIMTVDASNRYAVASAQLIRYFSGDLTAGMDNPLHTLTTKDREAVVLAHVTEFKGQDIGQPADTPLRTLTATPGEFAPVKVVVKRYDGSDTGHWHEIRDLLNQYCGYSIGADEILTLRIDGADYYIHDIGLRMLTPREAFNAQGFPADYIIDTDADGKPYGKTQQMARCGNAVCPPVACALVRANMTIESKEDVA